MEYGDYIVFVDESGDHNLEIVNPEYPVFVLALCVFRKEDYVNIVCPRVQQFKLAWFGHDVCILHEREIRKDLPPFGFLKSRAIKEDFLTQLTAIIADTSMTIIPAVIRKDHHKQRYSDPDNPYHLALLFCMERLALFLNANQQTGKLTHIIFEQRGGKAGGGEEDRKLELEFRRIMDGKHYLARRGFSNMEMEIIPKASNSIGLQLADLVARPIGLRCMRPLQVNRPFDIIRTKFMGSEFFPHNGMKVFP
ncbi:DUF3800 domain-containing protein [Mesorhizobium sp. M1A.F.Ca.IN.022.07.1.1]|nr:DUF3800 domain-containing protein [Mesorhizobium sp. M1A.F.Ca.IN.022.07.1.1]TIS69960.1 MAG: DUF3800 domain-containing protein [Mesorhizobium sp.]